MRLILGILIPFFGTTIGSAMVYFMKDKINNKCEKILLGFASGVMIAASVWSLIIPAIEMVSKTNVISWIPATVGFLCGVFFLYFVNTNRLNVDFYKSKEGNNNKIKKTLMMIFAVTIHNIPEGMAVGVIFAGAISGNTGITLAGAYALAIGIAIQNFPEGAIISMPLKSHGISRNKAFLCGVLSRHCRTNWSCYNINVNENYFLYFTVFTSICSRCDDLCCCRRAYSRI